MDDSADPLWVWRHPAAHGASGHCIGRTDLRVDPRRAKRLAHRIRRVARQHGFPHVVLTSPLGRCATVGQWLRRWGWRHLRDPALCEMDFGAWDGLPWTQVPPAELDAWCADFRHHPPGGGESLQAMFARVAAWTPPVRPALVVGHAGWMLARRWIASGRPAPERATQWPVPPRHGERWRFPDTSITAAGS